MEKCARLDELLINQPNVLDFTLLDSGDVKIAGMDDTFTMDELGMMLSKKMHHTSPDTIVSELKLNKHASIEIPPDVIPMRKEAENTAVIIDMYEVDYVPTTEGQTTQAITKNFDAMKDFISRMTFPDTTIPDIIVGPKDQIFKKRKEKVLRPDLPPETDAMDRPSQFKGAKWTPVSIWTKSEIEEAYPHTNNWVVVKPSPLGGVGLFAHSDIPRGTLIYSSQYKGKSDHSNETHIPIDKIKTFPQNIQKLYYTYGVTLNGGKEIAVPNSFNKMDLICYINHAKDNTANVMGDSNYDYYAKRDIKEGEELLLDYDTVDSSGENVFANKQADLAATPPADTTQQYEQYAANQGSMQQDGTYRMYSNNGAAVVYPGKYVVVTVPATTQMGAERAMSMATDIVNQYNKAQKKYTGVGNVIKQNKTQRGDLLVMYQLLTFTKGSSWHTLADLMGAQPGVQQQTPANNTSTQTNNAAQPNPQQTSQFGKQPDGTFRYTYRNASVLVNPNTNNILVNVWINGTDNNSVQVGINTASQIATNALRYYASNIQMPVQMVNRLQHKLNGNYMTVPFTFQVNAITANNATWKNMGKLG